MNVRKANANDMATLREFEQGVITAERPFARDLKGDPITYYKLDELLNSDQSELLVAELDGTIVGCGYAQLRSSKDYVLHDYHAYLGFMYVDPVYRGKGINKVIIQALMDWAKSRDVYELVLDVYDENEAAIKAYEKVGFSKNLVEMTVNIKDIQ